MKKFTKVFLPLFIMAFVLVAPPLSAQNSDVKIGGIYSVQGTNPGGKGSYTGTVTITPRGSVYQMDWKVGNTYSGIGILSGGILSVGWGNLAQAGYGVVSYNVQPNGVLAGTWAMAKGSELGKETLTPMK